MSHKFGDHTTNTGKALGNAFNGLGGMNTATAGTSIAISGVAGDVSFIDCNEIFGKKLDIGCFAQTTKGKVKLSFTLQNRKRACDHDPLVQKTIFWANDMELTPSVIEQLPVLFTALRIEFVEDSSFYIYAR